MPIDAFEQKMTELRAIFHARLPVLIADLERLIAEGPAGNASIRALAHKIAGQGGTFGAPSISRAAQEVETAATADLAAMIAELKRVSEGRS